MFSQALWQATVNYLAAYYIRWNIVRTGVAFSAIAVYHHLSSHTAKFSPYLPQCFQILIYPIVFNSLLSFSDTTENSPLIKNKYFSNRNITNTYIPVLQVK